MQRLKKHIAVFLLLVFSFVALPPSVWHNAFANHTDTADNYCDYYHKDLGTHVEGAHTTCDIFKTDTPLYDALSVQDQVKVFALILSEYKTPFTFTESVPLQITLPARAPPLA